MGRVSGKVRIVTGMTLADGTPLSRRGQPIDLANVVVFLASDGSRTMNGADLVLDQIVTVQQGFMP